MDAPDQQVLQTARNLYERQPDWVTFYREILGVDGIVYHLFPTAEERDRFAHTEEHAQIQRMLVKLRLQRDAPESASEPFKMITVRLPKSLREALRLEAKARHTSMNQLCISKLLQMIDPDFAPAIGQSGQGDAGGDDEKQEGARQLRLFED